MAKDYSLKPAVLDKTWDDFVQSSPDGTAFITAEYLRLTGSRLGLYHCFNKNELRAIVALAETVDGSSARLDDLIIYSGICFGAPTSGQNRAQRNSERFELATFIAAELAERYEHIECALAPSVADIRPFLWHNYGQESRRYNVDVRYTSYLDIADMAGAKEPTDINAYREATGARRQQIRYAQRDGIHTDEFEEVALFIDFYRKTFERQGEVVAQPVLERMGNLISGLLSSGLARMFAAKTRDGIIGSVAVFVMHNHCAYYLFGASDPDMRDSSVGTAVLWDAFRCLSAGGVTMVDLEGVNSPKRGWFKMSFGGRLQPYYQVVCPAI